MKNLKYFAFALMFGMAAACATDHEEFDTNTVRLQGAADVTMTVVDNEGNPIEGVSVSENHYDIDETTDANGQITIHFDVAPAAVSNLELKHDLYKTSVTTLPIGSVKVGDTKQVTYSATMYPKEYIYTATLAIYDKDDGLPVEGACVTVLNAGIGEVDPAYANADGIATVYLPAPAKGATDTYDVRITCYDFEETTASIYVTYSDEAKLGIPYETNCGAAVMKYTGQGKITGPHNVLIEKDLQIPLSTGYDGGSFTFSESVIVRAFGLDDATYATAVDEGLVTFVGVDVDGTEHASNTNANGCWWGEGGYVKGWGSSARVFFEGNSYCSFTVGQYPGQVESGATYPTCHKVSYTDEDGNTWEVVFKVNVTVV
ncbi:MAG: DUF4859 domain-containing protein [Odoribacter sp.]|nr:DUF4859 domain-containing protein [Odoribacter sp.]